MNTLASIFGSPIAKAALSVFGGALAASLDALVQHPPAGLSTTDVAIFAFVSLVVHNAMSASTFATKNDVAIATSAPPAPVEPPAPPESHALRRMPVPPFDLPSPKSPL